MAPSRTHVLPPSPCTQASKPGRGNAAPPPPPRQDSGFENDDTDSDVAEEDLDFVAQYSKRLGFLRDLDGDQLDRCVGKC